MTFWLNVPFEERKRAKELGCKWDVYFRQWWKPDAIALETIPIHWHLREGQRWNNQKGGVVALKKVK